MALFQSTPARTPTEWARLLKEATSPPRRATQPAPRTQATVQPHSAQEAPRTQATVQPHSAQEAAHTEAGSARPAEPQPAGSLSPLPANETPTTLSEPARRFLRPVVGFDPGDVRLYRGGTAAERTSAAGAEALAAGEDILLGAGQADETRPQTLGLLAHELTHVAARRQARFAPAVAYHETSPVTLSSSAQAEEQAARTVEHHVRQTAEALRPGELLPPANLPTPRFARAYPAALDVPGTGHPVSNAPTAMPQQPSPHREMAAEPTPDAAPKRSAATGRRSQTNGRSTAASGAREQEWGGLPAPWEPLPAWLALPAAEAPATSAPSVAPAAPIATPAAQPGPVFAAETDRALPDNPPANSPPAPEEQQQPAPDLDALARQVYDVLKQRLAAERRRLG
jgi:hypothetical protein